MGTEQNNEQKDLNSWDGYIGGSFLKADDVENDEQVFFIKKVESIYDDRDDQHKIRLEIENKGVSFILDLNKTNANFLKENKVEKPNDLMEKKICFKKVLTRNPRTNKEVEGIRICKVE